MPIFHDLRVANFTADTFTTDTLHLVGAGTALTVDHEVLVSGELDVQGALVVGVHPPASIPAGNIYASGSISTSLFGGGIVAFGAGFRHDNSGTGGTGLTKLRQLVVGDSAFTTTPPEGNIPSAVQVQGPLISEGYGAYRYNSLSSLLVWNSRTLPSNFTPGGLPAGYMAVQHDLQVHGQTRSSSLQVGVTSAPAGGYTADGTICVTNGATSQAVIIPTAITVANPGGATSVGPGTLSVGQSGTTGIIKADQLRVGDSAFQSSGTPYGSLPRCVHAQGFVIGESQNGSGFANNSYSSFVSLRVGDRTATVESCDLSVQNQIVAGGPVGASYFSGANAVKFWWRGRLFAGDGSIDDNPDSYNIASATWVSNILTITLAASAPDASHIAVIASTGIGTGDTVVYMPVWVQSSYNTFFVKFYKLSVSDNIPHAFASGENVRLGILGFWS